MEFLRSMLFLPGNNPNMVQNAALFDADAVIFDLEDSVSCYEKDAARILIASALRTLDFANTRTCVRINPLAESCGREDLRVIIPAKPDMIMIPKVNSAEDILICLDVIRNISLQDGDIPGLIPLIETPQGVAEAASIVRAEALLVGIAFGAEDYTAALGCRRTREGAEIAVARALISNAGAMAGIERLDTPFTDVQDENGLIADTELALSLGFTGKLVINPRQIMTIHEVFTPKSAEVVWARRVLAAIHDAREARTIQNTTKSYI